jgi:hypothetical protein
MTEIELRRFDDARGYLRQSLQIDRAAGAGLVAWGAPQVGAGGHPHRWRQPRLRRLARSEAGAP